MDDLRAFEINTRIKHIIFLEKGHGTVPRAFFLWKSFLAKSHFLRESSLQACDLLATANKQWIDKTKWDTE